MKKIISLSLLFVYLCLGICCVHAADIEFSDISVDLESEVTHNLVLPEEWEGTGITWTTDGVYIEADGTVNRPYPDDVTVPLIAEYGGITKTFTVTVKAFESKKDIVETAALYMSFSDISDDDSNAVANDMYLPGEGLYGTKIIWTSANPALLDIVSDGEGNYIGKVTRTYFGEGNYGVQLSAIFYYDNEFFEKRFYVNIAEDDTGFVMPEDMTNLRNAYRDAFLMHNDIFDMRSDLILPRITTDIEVICISGNNEVITNEGIVTRDKNYDKKVEFTVIFKKGYITTNLRLPIIVTAYSNDELENIPKEDVKNLIAEIMRKHSTNALMNNIDLKTTGEKGSKIVWTSSKPSVITNSGVVTRGSDDAKVTLTVSAEFKGHTYSESFDVIVKRNSTATVTGTGSTTGGGSGFSAPTEKPTPVTPPTSEIIYFTDISSDHWAYDSVMKLVENKVVSGYDDNTFRPNNYVTREEFVKMLLFATNSYKSGYGCEFLDVPKESWYYTYVSCAQNKGIVEGVSNDVFGSGVKLSRQDAAVMICRALAVETQTEAYNRFPDSDNIADYAKEAVGTLCEMGVINGDDNGYFNPTNNITRAEVAKILSLVM